MLYVVDVLYMYEEKYIVLFDKCKVDVVVHDILLFFSSQLIKCKISNSQVGNQSSMDDPPIQHQTPISKLY